MPIVAAPVFNSGGETVTQNEHQKYWDTYFDLYDDPNAIVTYPDKNQYNQEAQDKGLYINDSDDCILFRS